MLLAIRRIAPECCSPRKKFPTSAWQPSTSSTKKTQLVLACSLLPGMGAVVAMGAVVGMDAVAADAAVAMVVRRVAAGMAAADVGAAAVVVVDAAAAVVAVCGSRVFESARRPAQMIGAPVTVALQS
jgi:hypothetical protein